MVGIDYVDILVNAVLAIIMFGLGLTLTYKDFKQILVLPKAIITGLSIQIFIIPLIAFGVSSISGLLPEHKVGIVLVSACASGSSSNLITHLVRGNVALAISMTTLNSFITLATLPFIVSIALLVFLGKETHFSLPVLDTVLQIFMVTIAPAFIGILVKRYRSGFADRLEKPLKFILPGALFVVISLKIFGGNNGGAGLTLREGLAIFPFVLLLNVLAMVAGYYLSRVFRVSFRNQYTIAIEVGLHNTALALLVAGSIINSPEMEKPALVYAMFSFFTAILFIYVLKGNRIFKH